MESQDKSDDKYKMTEAELADFSRFWKSDAGQKYLGKLRDSKDQLLDAAGGSMNNEQICYFARRANVFQSILQDIEMTIKAKEEEEKPAKKK